MKKIQLKHNYTLPDFSVGWYVLATLDEIKVRQILSRTFAGEDLVVFKTESGRIVAMDAYCKHMGSHLGHGGKIEGETIVCPFHGFCFDPKGKCVKTGYGSKPSPRTNMNTWPLKITGGKKNQDSNCYCEQLISTFY